MAPLYTYLGSIPNICECCSTTPTGIAKLTQVSGAITARAIQQSSADLRVGAIPKTLATNLELGGERLGQVPVVRAGEAAIAYLVSLISSSGNL